MAHSSDSSTLNRAVDPCTGTDDMLAGQPWGDALQGYLLAQGGR